jgi:hypothetical protein
VNRRSFIGSILIAIGTVFTAKGRKFIFKIKTKSGGIVGNILIEAKDIEAAKYKLRKRYPNCEILEAREK